MEKECTTCGNFTAYYTKAYCRYLRADCGHCDEKKETVLKHATCEKWRSKIRYGLRVRSGIIIKEMENIVSKLNTLNDFINNNK